MSAADSSVPLSGRDLDVVQLVAKFRQLYTSHIIELVFDGLRSTTSAYRCLDRLTSDKYLHRIEQPRAGGARGGSGPYVYAPGRRAHFMQGIYREDSGRFDVARRVDYHSLAIADCYVTLKRMERAGVVTLAGVSTEPDCWVTIAGIQLRPDLYADVVMRDGVQRQMWLEMDMATEGQKQLKGTLAKYWRAFEQADVSVWPEHRRVVWVAVDDERETELCWLIGQGPDEAAGLFVVTTRQKLANLFI